MPCRVILTMMNLAVGECCNERSFFKTNIYFFYFILYLIFHHHYDGPSHNNIKAKPKVIISYIYIHLTNNNGVQGDNIALQSEEDRPADAKGQRLRGL